MEETPRTPGESVRPESEEWNFEVVCKDAPIPLIPPGRYLAQTVRCERRVFLGTQKRAYVWLEIIDGPQFGIQLYMALNISYAKFGRGTKLYKMLGVALGRLPRRNEHLSLGHFKQKIFQVEVVTADSEPRYSIVSRLIALEAGGAQ